MVGIDHALGEGERERLLKRTRTRRGEEKVVGKVVLEGEEARQDEECFDDADFYAQMLRDLVESRMLDLGKLTWFSQKASTTLMPVSDDPTLASLRLASARGKKQKKVVDTRASKGRKIRYVCL